MSRAVSPRTIGLFVIGAVILAVIAVVAFGSGRYFRETVTVVSFFEGSLAGLQPGAAVRYRGVTVGAVEDILFFLPNDPRDSVDLRIAVLYAIDPRAIQRRGGGATDAQRLAQLVDQGLVAELGTESVVTGRRFVALDIDASREPQHELVAGLDYVEIPAVRGRLADIEDELGTIVSNVLAMSLDSIALEVRGALTGITELVDSRPLKTTLEQLPSAARELRATMDGMREALTALEAGVDSSQQALGRVAEDVSSTLRSLEQTAVALRAAVEPGSPVVVRLEQALQELAVASRSLTELTDFLQRNPSALVRGKAGQE